MLLVLDTAQSTRTSICNDVDMTPSTSSIPQTLPEAFADWEAAVESLLKETSRVSAGGLVDPRKTAELEAAADIARQLCKELALQERFR
jgi:hypothetical protein